MELSLAIINALLYIVVFLLYWRKNKGLNLFNTIILAYILVAVFGCVLINEDIVSYKLSLYNFIYLFVCIMIFIWPFRYARFTTTNILIKENGSVKLFVLIFFITGAISLIYSIPRAITMSQMDDWAAIRNEYYKDPDAVKLYGSTFERLIKNIYNYLAPFGIVMAVYQFTKKQFNALFAIALLFVWGANAYCDSTIVASRGVIVFVALNLVIAFQIFYKSIPDNRKKIIYLIGIIIGVFFISFLTAVSQSRFEKDAGDSALWYMGQSMNVFNQDIMAHMHDYADGKYFFKWVCPWFGVDPDIDFKALGSTHGVQFMTFVGCFYIDFGPIGTVIIGLFMCWLLTRFTRQSHYYLSDIIVITYYANWYIKGALVHGYSQSLGWTMLFVVYFIVRTIETRRVSRSRRLYL